jgi:hypothetical protein
MHTGAQTVLTKTQNCRKQLIADWVLRFVNTAKYVETNLNLNVAAHRYETTVAGNGKIC